MFHSGGVTGDCICAYAIAQPNYGLVVTGGGIDLSFPSTSSSIHSGTLTTIDYQINEYIGGFVNSVRVGTLNSGDPTIIESYLNPDSTYLIGQTFNFDDGASCRTVSALERRTGGVITATTWDVPTFELNCRDAIISNLNLDSGGRTTDENWFDGNLQLVQSGDVFNGELPQNLSGLGTPLTLIFVGGLDPAEWTDLPLSIQGIQMTSIGTTMINCVE